MIPQKKKKKKNGGKNIKQCGNDLHKIKYDNLKQTSHW